MQLQKMDDLPEGNKFIFEHHATEAHGSFVEMHQPKDSGIQGTFIWKGSDRCVIYVKHLDEGQELWSYNIDWDSTDNLAEMTEIYIMNMRFWDGPLHGNMSNLLPALCKGLTSNPNRPK